ncbi:Hypothetical_protein [Hexamita inflata]|uniref:Hypothetical_protein n=1 Tax=Hexamita inflata TaxID=28002 RepID=A0AA86TT78_9EUKA|nr:Hypothetical protein HINF_LOCUS15466 [Hexamita inflata]
MNKQYNIVLQEPIRLQTTCRLLQLQQNILLQKQVNLLQKLQKQFDLLLKREPYCILGLPGGREITDRQTSYRPVHFFYRTVETYRPSTIYFKEKYISLLFCKNNNNTHQFYTITHDKFVQNY